ncbi:MAG: ABC transporter permease, partial [Bacteroidota bacterium]
MLIITIGITCLVGILTAVDSIQAKVNDSFADLGANSFEITVPSGGRRRFGQRIIEKTYPPIDYREAIAYKKRYKYPAQVSLSVGVSGASEIKYQSNKTNPNISVLGGNEYYLQAESLDLEYGRNFSNIEQKQGTFVAMATKVPCFCSILE